MMRGDRPLERVLRDEWGRLLALLVAQYRRLDLAEDGLGDAFEAAARTWPDLPGGVPDNPPAWLLTAARRRIVDRLRTESVAARKLPLLAVEAELTEEAQRTMTSGEAAGVPVTDERLRLVLLCAHPSLAPESAAALTLRMVMGVSHRGPGPAVPGDAGHDGGPADPGPQVAGRRVVLGAGGRRAGESRVGVVADVAYLAFTAGYAPGSGADVLRADVAGGGDPAGAGAAVGAARSIDAGGRRARRAARADAAAALPARRAGGRRRGWCCCRTRTGRGGTTTRSPRPLDLLTPLARTRRSTPYLLQALIAAEHAVAPSAAEPTGPGSWLVRRARGAHRLPGRTAQPGGRRRRGRRPARRPPAPRRARPARAPASRGAGRAAGPRRPARRRAPLLRRGDRALRQRGRACPPAGAPAAVS